MSRRKIRAPGFCLWLTSLCAMAINLHGWGAEKEQRVNIDPTEMEVEAEFHKEKSALTFVVRDKSGYPLESVQVSVRRSLDLKEPLQKLGATDQNGRLQIKTAIVSLQPNCWFIFEKRSFRPYIVFWRKSLFDRDRMEITRLCPRITITITYPDGKHTSEEQTFYYYASAATVSSLNLQWMSRGRSYVFYVPPARRAAEEMLALLSAQEQALSQMRFPVTPIGVIFTEPLASIPNNQAAKGIWVEGIPAFPMPYAEREAVKQQWRELVYPALVHERVEMALAFDLEMFAEGTRWFREGVAEWLSVRVTQQIMGSAKAYLDNRAGLKESEMPQQPLNLMEWSGSNEAALYAAALAQVEAIDRKAGKDWLQSVLASWVLTAHANQERPSAATLIHILNVLVGEDIEKGLKAVNFADSLCILKEMRDKCTSTG